MAQDEKESSEIPGTMAIMVIYLVLFMVGFIVMFAYLGGKWPIS